MEGGLAGLRWNQNRRRRERDPLLLFFLVSALLPTRLDSLLHLHRRYHPHFHPEYYTDPTSPAPATNLDLPSSQNQPPAIQSSREHVQLWPFWAVDAPSTFRQANQIFQEDLEEKRGK